jgi:hypothetical protein
MKTSFFNKEQDKILKQKFVSAKLSIMISFTLQSLKAINFISATVLN